MSPTAEDEVDELVAEARAKATGDVHYPNHISGPLRRRHILQSLLIFLYAILGLYAGKLSLRVKAHTFTFEGVSALVLVAAMFMAALNLLSIVLDHYDKRDNERSYECFAQVTRVSGWILLALATLLHVLQV